MPLTSLRTGATGTDVKHEWRRYGYKIGTMVCSRAFSQTACDKAAGHSRDALQCPSAHLLRKLERSVSLLNSERRTDASRTMHSSAILLSGGCVAL